ncbi:MAG: CDGSH iron-sulfur domain-containing protein [Candidatus Methanomethylophilaceae archaeon]|nr:CDGSH iron-sulfur domain-containing protein [Candidatus Methanomethylophilaceae archaeon]
MNRFILTVQDMTDENAKITIKKNGPYLIFGNIPLREESIQIDAMGKAIKWVEGQKFNQNEVYALCRCGKSSTMPFCSGEHVNKFDGTETADDEPYNDSCLIHEGCDGVKLMEKHILCTGAGFCHAYPRIEIAIKNKKTLEVAKQECANCPGGSLTLVINGEKIEPILKKEISVTNDVKTIGPIWVKGEIPIISANNEQYELRNRVALCRCGRSKNKPFCDASHLK